MNIKDFDGYRDVNGLLAPNPCDPTLPGSDNGPMFTSEYLIMESRASNTRGWIESKPYQSILACISPNGMLNRLPSNSGQTGPDDYLGVLALCKEGSFIIPARGFLRALIRYYGFLNNQNPGQHTKESFLIRQPQLPCAMISASFPSLINPVHWAIRIAAFPFYLYTSLVILTSCINTPVDSTDPRRLSWLLIQTTRPVSLLCWLAAKIWYKRLYKDYGSEGMKAVAGYYYQPKGLGNNPYSKWWVD